MKRPPSNAGVGASSIMLIIVVLCLTLFGVLSYVTALNDSALTSRTLESTQVYYETDAAAQRALMAVDAWLLGGREGAPEGVELMDNGDGSLSFSVSTDGAHALSVRLRPLETGYIIESYRYENISDWSPDTAQELFN